MTDTWSPDLFAKAYQFAARAHRRQLLNSTKLPYLVHISLVCMEVMTALTIEPGHDNDFAIMCALLHDVIEDTQKTYKDIEKKFGRAVADGVLALSKDKAVRKSDRMQECLRRIQLQPPEVGMIKLADRITNLRPPPKKWKRKKISEYQEEARSILDTVKDASPYLARRLAEKIQQYSVYLEKKK